MENKQVVCDRRNATLMNNDKWLQFYARWFEYIVYGGASVFDHLSFPIVRRKQLYCISVFVWTVQSAITLTYFGYDLWATFLFHFRHTDSYTTM